jgi:hypothetical protein
MISETSLAAYQAIIGDGRVFTQRQKVLIATRKCPGATRHELSGITGFPINAICGRIAELIHDGFVREGEKKVRPETKAQAFTLYPTEN